MCSGRIKNSVVILLDTNSLISCNGKFDTKTPDDSRLGQISGQDLDLLGRSLLENDATVHGRSVKGAGSGSVLDLESNIEHERPESRNEHGLAKADLLE